jgi:hypothetical protein
MRYTCCARPTANARRHLHRPGSPTERKSVLQLPRLHASLPAEHRVHRAATELDRWIRTGPKPDDTLGRTSRIARRSGDQNPACAVGHQLVSGL